MSDLAAEPLVAEPLVTSSRKGRSRIQTFRSDWPVLPPLGLSLVLHFWALTSAGWGNAYYAAAVRAMRMNWRNFLFAAAEPGGFVSVDKPPLALWVQTISSWIFGYNKFALLAPQALAGSAAVVVLYFTVKQVWGRTAGTVAAFVLAHTPINVMVNHSNNMDAVLVLVMTVGAFFGVRAAITGRLRTFIVACAFAGTAVTAKMLAAVPLMPALLIAYLWCAPLRWTARLRNVGIGIVVLAVSGLWWFAVVDLTPAGSRPYVGSSPTNSAFQLAFERNGVGQVEGTSSGTPGGGPGGRFGGGPGGGFGGANRPNRNGGIPNFPGGGPFANGPLGNGPLGDGQPGAGQPGTGQPGAGSFGNGGPYFAGGFGGRSGGRGGGIGGAGGIPQLGFNGGTPGPLRLFNEALGAQAGWLIPFALVASFAALVLVGLRGSKRLVPIIVFGGWFVAAATAFSMTKGIVHPYYLSNLGPPIAALAGIGAAALIEVLRRGKRALALFVPVAVVASAAASWTLLTQPSWSSWRPWLKFGVASALTLVAVFALVPKFSRSHRQSQFVVGSAVLGSLIAPALWTQSSLASGVNANLPFASAGAEGAGTVSQNALRPNGGFTYLSGDQKKLVKYLEANHRDEKWQLAVQSAGQAEPFVISHAMPVMIMGGFIGSDPILTEESLRAHIASGDVRYFLTSAGGPGGFGGGGFGGPGVVGGPGGFGGGFGGGRGPLGGGLGGGLGGSNAAAFVADECSEVPASAWGGDEQATGETVFPGGPTSGSFTLYDCGALTTSVPT